MKHLASFAIRSILLFLLLGLGAVLVNLFAFPVQTFAAEMVVQTKQVLPPGGSSCSQLSATGFTAYIYDGALHSFEFSVSDSSYVALIGSVGDTAIPFQLMTRRMDGSTLRYHVDIEASPVRGTLPITVTMLSSKQGEPTCLSMVATTLLPAGNVTGTGSPVSSPGPGVTQKPIVQDSNATSGTAAQTTTTAASTSASTTIASIQNFLKDICASGRAPAMWFVLLVIYAAFVWAATSGQIKISFAERLEWTAAAIIIPLILLLALWYFPENCRAEAWVPAVGIVIAIAALLATYGSNPPTTETKTKVISLPAGRTDRA